MTRPASNVVRRTDKSPPRITRWKEQSLILLCVRFAANVGGLNGAFAADPTGNNDFAETLDDGSWKERSEAIEGLALMRAKTAPGISAKARIVPILLEHRAGSELNQADLDFLLWFAEDVKNFVAPMVRNEP